MTIRLEYLHTLGACMNFFQQQLGLCSALLKRTVNLLVNKTYRQAQSLCFYIRVLFKLDFRCLLR